MKKALFTAIILLIMATALLASAGCTTTTDPITGNWVSEKTTIIDGYNANAELGIAFTFNADGTGTGMLIGVGTTENTQAGFTAEHSLTWKKTGANTYTITINTLTETVERTLSLNGDKFTAETGITFKRVTSNANSAVFQL